MCLGNGKFHSWTHMAVACLSFGQKGHSEVFETINCQANSKKRWPTLSPWSDLRRSSLFLSFKKAGCFKEIAFVSTTCRSVRKKMRSSSGQCKQYRRFCFVRPLLSSFIYLLYLLKKVDNVNTIFRILARKKYFQNI